MLTVELTAERLLEEASTFGLKKERTDGEFRDFDITKRKSFKNANGDDFLLPFEKQHLLGSLLDRIHVPQLEWVLNKNNEKCGVR